MPLFYTLSNAFATARLRRLPVVSRRCPKSSKLLLGLPMLTAYQRGVMPVFAPDAAVLAAPTKAVPAFGPRTQQLLDPRNGLECANALVPDQRLRGFCHPYLKATIDSGVGNIMTNSGKTNGKAVHASKAILTYLLRKQKGFGGVAVTDRELVIRLVQAQNVAPNGKKDTWIAINVATAPHTTNFCRNA